MNRPLKLSLAVALALGSAQAFALGLGSIEVKSKMNEPLLAEIPVVAASPEEAQALRVKLAGADDFERIGLDQSGLSVPLEFIVTSDDAGRPIIIVTSTDPVREPFVSFLIEVDWANGRLLREFSVLLDPPVAPAVVGTRTIAEPIAELPAAAPESIAPSAPIVSEPEPAPEPAPDPVFSEPEVQPPPAAEPEPVAEQPAPVEPEFVEPAPEPIAAEPEPAPPVEEPAPSPTYEPEPARDPGEYGPVADGETLWEIANNTRPSGADMNQMMLAILRANPDAFYKDNVNALKRGAILRIPTSDQISAWSGSEAMAEIVAQHQSWTAATVVADSGYTPPASTGTPPDPAPADSRLALVPPNAGDDATSDRPGAAGGTDESATLRSDLARTKEQLASSNQESTELRQRVQELETIQGDTSRLLELRSTEMAELQRRLAAAEAESERLRAEEATRESALAAAPPPAAPEAVAEPPAADATPVDPIAPETTAATPTDSAVPPADPVIDPAAAAAAAALAEGDPSSDATTDAATTDATSTDPLTTDPATTPIDGASDGTSPDPLAADPGATADGAEVVPLAEPEPVDTAAPVEPDRPSWMAYLRNPYVLGGAGALAVLALLALLMRARRREVETVEARPSVADSFDRGVFGGGAAAAAVPPEGDEEREHLERLASDPTDVDAHLDLLRLYYARGDSDKFEAAAGALYAQVPGPESAAWREAAEMGRALCPGNALFDLPVESAREEFDFDHVHASSAPPPRAPEPVVTAPPLTPVSSEAGFDFNLLDDKPTASHADAGNRTQQMPVPDFNSLDTSRPVESSAPDTDSNAFNGDDDAVGTKLDLARAYLDMGDPEGARSMLQEVLAEGSEGQKSEAKRLLADIG